MDTTKGIGQVEPTHTEGLVFPPCFIDGGQKLEVMFCTPRDPNKVVTDGVAGLSGCGWCGVYSEVAHWGVNVLKGVECGTCVSDDWGVLGGCVWALGVCA